MARRRTFWLATVFDYVGVAAGVVKHVMVSDADLHDVSEEPTVIRMIGRLHFQFERDTGGFQESMRSVCWLGIVCGHSSLPAISPKLQGDQEQWMWTSFLDAEATFQAFPDREFDSNVIIGANVTTSWATQHIPSVFETVDFDARAMRKAPEPCDISLITDIREVLPEFGAQHRLSGYIRFLCKA